MTKKVLYGYGGLDPLTEAELVAEYKRLGITPTPDTRNSEAATNASPAKPKATNHIGNGNFH